MLYVLLAPLDNEQSDLLHRIYEEKKLSLVPLYKWVAEIVLLNIVLSFWGEDLKA